MNNNIVKIAVVVSVVGLIIWLIMKLMNTQNSLNNSPGGLLNSVITQLS